MPEDLTSLLQQLAEPATRHAAAETLARWLDSEEALLLVRDPELGVLLSAPGFPPTLRGGTRWRQFLQRCADGSGRYQDRVELPAGTPRDALALVTDGLALVLLGPPPDAEKLAALEALLPLLGASLRAEQRARIAEAAAAAAQAEVERAQVLATALEVSRAQLTRLNAELRSEDRRKDEFLAMLAHELRNPLTPLINSIELMRRRPNDPQAVERQLDVMGRQVHQLSRLVEDLLDMSRISRGRIELRREPLRLDEILANAVEASRPFLEGRRHDLVLDLGERRLWVQADSVRLAQVFSNLLHNAAKYTDPGGRISVGVGEEEGFAVVRVHDSGVGIDAAILPHIFDLFTQAPVAMDRAQGGLGIGLTLVRSLVELHGGSVTAESGGLGFGSCFTVRLPLTSAPVAAAPQPQRREGETAPTQVLQVLVVDDNVDGADSLAAMIRLLGHHVEVAYSGLSALQLAADLPLDLVLLDIGLPEMDGYEVGRRMRRLTPRAARFVALTGYGSDDDRRRSREAGFDEHQVKPIALGTLQELLARTMSQARPRMAMRSPAVPERSQPQA